MAILLFGALTAVVIRGRTSGAASTVPTRSANPTTAARPLRHPCALQEIPVAEQHAGTTCSSGQQAWCDEHEARIACCAPNLVAVGSDGICECPPGGTSADHPDVVGCARSTLTAAESSQLVRDVMRGTLPVLKDCYEAAVSRTPGVGGKVELSVNLTPEGEVFSARIKGATLSDAPAQACMLAAVRTLKFAPPPGGEATIAYPMVLSDGADGAAPGGSVSPGQPRR